MSADHNYEGRIVGGPLDGQETENNTSKGFLLIDQETSTVWVHDFQEGRFFGNKFLAREGEPIDLAKLEKAQEDGGRSVRILWKEGIDG